MSLPALSVRRPVLVSMVALIVIVLGMVSYRQLKIDLLPEIELPTLSVRTDFPGASPEVMEMLVTRILEEIIATTPGIVELTSTSSEGESRINVVFGWGTDIDQAAVDLQATIEDEISELPEDVMRPRVSKFDPGSFPVVLLGISSKLDPVELAELMENQLRHRLTRIPGVAQADTWGAYDREIRIEIDSDRLLASGVTLEEVVDALESANLDLPAGKIRSGRYEVTLRAPAEFASLEEVHQTSITRRDGTSIRIADVAEVKDTYQKLTRIVRVDDELGLRVAIRKKAGANTVEVSRNILEEIERINEAYPQIVVKPVINQGNFIQRSIENVAMSVLYGGSLAIVLLLFFLRSLRSTIIIALAIPISIIATFSLIYFLGFTINLMTLGGLALGVGMMVDNSIVVLENIFRKHQDAQGDASSVAAGGTSEVSGAIIASTITTLVIFLPVFFVQGVTGVLFRDLAFVVIFSLCCSLLVALSLVPMLCAHMLGDPSGKPEAQSAVGLMRRLATISVRVMNAMEERYENVLARVLRHPRKAVGLVVFLLMLTLLFIPRIGTEFLPPSDEGEVRVRGEVEMGTQLEIADRLMRQVEAVVNAHVPEMVSSVTSVRTPESSMNISLVPSDERKRSNEAIAEDLRRRLEGEIPGMKIRTRAPQGQFLLERLLGGEEGLKIEIRGDDFEVLRALGEAVQEAIAGIPGITDTQRDITEGIPQDRIQIDRQKVMDMGLRIRDITQVLQVAFAGADVGEYRTGGNSYRIFVQLKDADQRSIEEVLDLPLMAPGGEEVALRNLVSVQSGRGPRSIARKEQQRIASVSVNVAGGDMGSVVADVKQALGTIALPSGYSFAVVGSYEEQQKSFRELVIAFTLSIMLVYMVLAAQYESLRKPLVVMFSVPTAAIGVVLTLLLTDTTFNLQSGIGCIMLGGIVVNNAILLVDQAGQLQLGGMRLLAALQTAGRRRLRPILMTTLTTALGLLPLALGIGEGSEAQAPMARVVIGGLMASMLITLLLIPALYLLFFRGSQSANN